MEIYGSLLEKRGLKMVELNQFQFLVAWALVGVVQGH